MENVFIENIVINVFLGSLGKRLSYKNMIIKKGEMFKKASENIWK